MIRVQDVSFAFQPDEPVLSDLSFSVERGELLGIIGPNGSGKTTLIRILGRALEPHSGMVFLEGKPLSQYGRRDLARKVAVVPQETIVAFPFTVLEIALMGRAPYLGRFAFEKAEDLEKARDALRLTDTLRFARRRLGELSGGEKQRVILARALAQDPRLLLLDEPTTFLDLKHQLEIYRLIKKLTLLKGLTVIASSHDLNLAGMFSDRLLLLDEGRKASEGKPEDVLNKDVLGSVYGVEVDVSIHPRTGRPLVVPEVHT
jgi:iron complex transport system ATP-binding protein